MKAIEKYIGLRGLVQPMKDDVFSNEFVGNCIAVKGNFLQIRDSNDDVFDVEVSQFTPIFE